MTTTTKTAAYAHGYREGAADYDGRAADVASGREAPEWAWPLAGADSAYLDALGTGSVCRALGLDESAWDLIAATWLAGFEAGYRAAHDDE